MLSHVLSRKKAARARNAIAAFGLLAAGALAAGCSEDLETDAACPALCPNQNVQIVDTTLPAVALDTSIASFPALGVEPYVLVASRGDTLQTRGVFRFDSLPQRFRRTTSDTAELIESLDSAYLRVRFDLSRSKLNGTAITVEAYDVDTTAADSLTGAVAALFRPDRFLGSVSLAPADVKDSLHVPLSPSAMLDKFVNAKRLRVGLRVVSDASTQLRIVSVENASAATAGPLLVYYPVPGDTIARLVGPLSTTPADQPAPAVELTDYTVIVVAPAGASTADALVVGGMPARRAYLRFDIPPGIIDSATVIRATLVLTQKPNAGLDPIDTLGIFPQVVTAGSGVTDVARALLLLGPAPDATSSTVAAPRLDSISTSASDGTTHVLEVVQVLQVWRVRPDSVIPRAIALRSSLEGSAAPEVTFYSSEAPEAVRPQLRISYVPRVPFGLP